eukprot:gene45455-56620_t
MSVPVSQHATAGAGTGGCQWPGGSPALTPVDGLGTTRPLTATSPGPST